MVVKLQGLPDECDFFNRSNTNQKEGITRKFDGKIFPFFLVFILHFCFNFEENSAVTLFYNLSFPCL